MFVCKPCKVSFNTKYSYQRHCQSIKHNDNVKKSLNKINTEMICNKCNHQYKHSSSFYRHRKTCKGIKIESTYQLEFKNLKEEHTKIISEHTKIMAEIKMLREKENEKEQGPIEVVNKTKRYKAKIPSAVRKIVWNIYIGKDKIVGKCLCCDAEDISNINFECGHILSEKNGGEVNVENLRPICGHCNKSIGSKNMDEFMELYKIKRPNNWNGILKSENESLETFD